MSQHHNRVPAEIAPGIPEKMARAMKMHVQWIAFLQTGLTGPLAILTAMERATEPGQFKQLPPTEELHVTTQQIERLAAISAWIVDWTNGRNGLPAQRAVQVARKTGHELKSTCEDSQRAPPLFSFSWEQRQ